MAAAPLDLAPFPSAPAPAAGVSWRLAGLLWLIGLGAVAAALLVVWLAPPPPPSVAYMRITGRIVPRTELPAVEPVAVEDISPDDARDYNAAIPFASGPNPAARPFRFETPGDDLARATDCLATAVYYEAGDDAPGEQAVAQVVLNRVRHPAFPKTVCGVVFQGSERTTGCQFTFSCDGSLHRYKPTADGWRRAREIAAAALSGSVYKPVGYATHYHTDYVVPYWQASLDKLAQVHTQLFYRWTGWWGTPPAFDRRHEPGEPVEPQIAALSDAHRLGASLAQGAAASTQAAGMAPGTDSGAGGPPPAVAAANDADSFLVTLPKGLDPDSYLDFALRSCGDRRRCVFMSWQDPQRTPRSTPLEPAQVASMTFSYLRDDSVGFVRFLWNCDQVKRSVATQCMKQQVLLNHAAPVTAAPGPAASVPSLGDVRRKPAPAASPAPSPTPPGTSPAATP